MGLGLKTCWKTRTMWGQSREEKLRQEAEGGQQRQCCGDSGTVRTCGSYCHGHQGTRSSWEPAAHPSQWQSHWPGLCEGDKPSGFEVPSLRLHQ